MKYLALSTLIFCFLQVSSCKTPAKKSEAPALISTIKKCKFKKVRECLRQGADPNIPDADGNMPLSLACYYDKTGKIIDALLQAGAKIDAKDKDGWISFDWAHKASNASAIKLLIQTAIAQDKLTIRGYDGKTLLHYAAVLDDAESSKIVEQLLALSLDPNAKDQYGCTPLDYATRADVIVAIKTSNIASAG